MKAPRASWLPVYIYISGGIQLPDGRHRLHGRASISTWLLFAGAGVPCKHPNAPQQHHLISRADEELTMPVAHEPYEYVFCAMRGRNGIYIFKFIYIFEYL